MLRRVCGSVATAALVLGTVMGATVGAQPVGAASLPISTVESCNSALVLHTINCSITANLVDTSGNLIVIYGGTDYVDTGPGGNTPVQFNLAISAVSGNTTCRVGGTLFCFIGPSGSTLSGLPGSSANGTVTFTSNSYVIQPTDSNPLGDIGYISEADECNVDPSGWDCAQNAVQSFGSTPWTTNPSSTTTQSSSTGTNVVPGTAVTDTATVSPSPTFAGAPTPTGNVSFFICGPSLTSVTPGCSTSTGTAVGSAATLSGGSATTPAGYSGTTTPGAYCWAAAYSGDTVYSASYENPTTNSNGECFATATQVTQAVYGFTPGFWSNKNGNAMISSETLLPVTLGGSTRGVTVSDVSTSNALLTGHEGCDNLSPTCAAGGLSPGLQPNTLNEVVMQTLAFTYNITGVSGYAANTVAVDGCSAYLTPSLTALGLSATSSVSDVLSVANQLIDDSTATGSMTEQQARDMNALLGDCLNQEA